MRPLGLRPLGSRFSNALTDRPRFRRAAAAGALELVEALLEDRVPGPSPSPSGVEARDWGGLAVGFEKEKTFFSGLARTCVARGDCFY